MSTMESVAVAKNSFRVWVATMIEAPVVISGPRPVFMTYSKF